MAAPSTNPEPQQADPSTQTSPALVPILAPYIAAFPQYLNTSSAAQHFIMTRLPNNKDYTVQYASGQPFLSINAVAISMTRRKHVVDSATGETICDLRRNSSVRYGCDTPDNVQVLDINFRGGRGAVLEIVSCNNVYQECLQFKPGGYGFGGEVTLRGMPVATIGRSNASGQSDLMVAPGLDPFVVVVLALVQRDQSPKALYPKLRFVGGVVIDIGDASTGTDGGGGSGDGGGGSGGDGGGGGGGGNGGGG